MRNSDTYQLVLEHSILSTQRKIRDAAGAHRRSNQRISTTSESEFRRHDDKTEEAKLGTRQNSEQKQFWKRRTKGDVRRSRRDHAQCIRRRNDEVSEKNFIIYLDMNLHWLQHFYVTVKSRKPEKNTKELGEEGWNENFEEDLKFQKTE